MNTTSPAADLAHRLYEQGFTYWGGPVFMSIGAFGVGFGLAWLLSRLGILT